MKGKTTLILILVAALVLAGTAGAVAGSLMDWNFAGYFAKSGEDMLATRPSMNENPMPTEPTEPENTLPMEPEYPEFQPEAITLSIWAPWEDMPDENGWLPSLLENFEAEHPEYEITWVLGVCSEGDVVANLAADVEAAADVFFFANDQMGTLKDMQVLTKLGGEYLEQVLADNSQTMVETVTCTDGDVYGFPMTTNTWFMYYNKSVYSEEDIKSLDAMLEKGTVAFPLTNPWYNWSFYAAGGATLFGDHGNDAAAGVRLGANGAAITKYLVNLVNHPNFINDENGMGYAGLGDGSVAAMFSGSWDAAGIYEILGDNMGVAPLPSINVEGNALQLKAFAGSKAVGINPNSQHMEAALQLAAFISSQESQLLRYELRKIPPAATDLMYQYPISEDEIAVVQALTMEYASVVQPYIPEMNNYWNPAGSWGYSLYNGEVTLENYVEHTDYFEQMLNDSGL